MRFYDSNGNLKVTGNGSNVQSLNDLTDVNHSAASGDILQNDGSVYVSRSPSQLAGDMDFADLGDVNPVSPATNEIVRYNAGVYETVSLTALTEAIMPMSALSDMDFTASEWDALYRNGSSQWAQLQDAFHGHYGRIYRSNAQTIGNASFTSITGTSVTGSDLSGMTHSSTNGYLEVTLGGIYHVMGSVAFTSNSNGSRIAVIETFQGATWSNSAFFYVRATSGLNDHVNIHVFSSASSGQRFRLRCYQNSGGNLNTIGGVSATWLSATLVRRIGIV